MAIPRNAIAQVIEAILEGGARKATKYITPRDVVKATRRHKRRKNARTTEMVVTVGRPNYAERAFILSCQKAGEPFPVRNLKISYPGKKTKES